LPPATSICGWSGPERSITAVWATTPPWAAISLPWTCCSILWPRSPAASPWA
jgi:hypothetical protein